MDDSERLLYEKYNGKKTPEYAQDLARLALGEPLAYVIGWIPFLGCKIFLDSHPLIPRPETEYWVEQALTSITHSAQRITKKGENPALRVPSYELRVLDLFAGSGAIGIAVLRHVPNARVDFGEIDERHFPTIRKNIAENIQENHIDTKNPRGFLVSTRIIHTDVWSGIRDTYDIVFANPPYLSKNRTEKIQKSVLAHEPKTALFAEDDGFALIEKTIFGLPNHLVSGGQCYIEHEPEHRERIHALAGELGMTAETHPDQYGILRYSRLERAIHNA